jgi:hypothetical protein
LSFLATAVAISAEPTSDEAESALSKAEVSVAAARARGALWTTAQNALREARAARNRGDFAATVRLSGEANTLAELGIAQKASQP